jgi:hypothetical protein
VVIIVILYKHYKHENHSPDLRGGSREAIFSRFKYTPEFPFMSKFDTVDLDRFSKVYNIAGRVKFIMGRPYKLYHTEKSTWLYPWEFPEEINMRCIKEASTRCNEPIIMIKREEDKLSGLAVPTPKDVVRVSDCFDKIYERCQA